MTTQEELRYSIEELKDKRIQIDNLIATLVKKYNLTEKNIIVPATIERIICKYFEVTPEMLKGKNRQQNTKLARQFYFYLCRKYTKHSLTKIGKKLERHHATVLHSINQIEHYITYYDEEKEIIKELEEQISTYQFGYITE